tara:strand:+ start:703 stop:936 length:234 start_codon:yes stop_codon:yes gene_type:complete
MKIIYKKGNKALIYYNNNFYVVSEAKNLFTGHREETLIFKSEPDGTVIDYLEVGGGRYLTLNDVLSNIDEHLYKQEI